MRRCRRPRRGRYSRGAYNTATPKNSTRAVAERSVNRRPRQIAVTEKSPDMARHGMLTPMRFSLIWMFAAMVYVALALTAIWQRSAFCATVLCAGVIAALLHTLYFSVIARGETQGKAFQWGAVGSLSFVGVCLALWLTSIVLDVADFELSFGRSQMRVSDGSVVICDHLANLEVIDLVEKSWPMSPPPQDKYGFSILGMSCRYITFVGSDEPLWSLRASLLIPAGVAMLAAIFSILKARRSPSVARRGYGV
jgi:hypothetical protein